MELELGIVKTGKAIKKGTELLKIVGKNYLKLELVGWLKIISVISMGKAKLGNVPSFNELKRQGGMTWMNGSKNCIAYNKSV